MKGQLNVEQQRELLESIGQDLGIQKVSYLALL